MYYLGLEKYYTEKLVSSQSWTGVKKLHNSIKINTANAHKNSV